MTVTPITSRLPGLRAAVDRATSDDARIEAMLELSELLTELDPPEALAVAHGALDIARRTADDLREARAVLAVGRGYYFLRRYDEATTWLTEALARSESLGDRHGEMSATASLGRLHASRSRDDHAEELFRRALGIAEECGDRFYIVRSLYGLGKLFANSDPERAREYLSSGLAVAREIGFDAGLLQCMEFMGQVLANEGERDEALRTLSDALALASELGLPRMIAAIRQKIGDVCLDLGDYAAALDHFQFSNAAMTELSDLWGIANATMGIGNVHYLLGDAQIALDYYRRSVDMWTELGDESWAIFSSTNVGRALEDMGRYDEALEHYRTALIRTEEHGPRRFAALCHGDIADVHRLRGEYSAALIHYQRALSILEEIGDKQHLAHFRGAIGLIYATQTFEGYDPDRAEELLLSAIAVSDEAGFRWILEHDHKRLSELYQQEGKWQKAHEQTVLYYEVKAELHSIDAQKKAQQVEHDRQLAELEKQRAIEQAQFEAAEEIHRMKGEQMDRELANATLQLLAQTELLSELRHDLLMIARKIPPTEPAARELRERVKRLPCESVDWEKFDAQFRQVHPEFVRTLTKRAPDLTPTEIRICSMLRMNLKSIEIAQIFCTTEKGVEFHRTNIRRKLGVRREEKLPVVLGAM
jgi:tetratricopeptide (TPR) repeat protein/DNA-binding CsgD family transcriptional regulator